jgi:hypothetical protein
MIKYLNRAMLLTALCLCRVAVAEEAARESDSIYPVKETIGVIEDIDLDSQMLVVDGLRFRVALDATVTIHGSYGAFTLLTKGMLVRCRYHVVSPTEREIYELETRPPNEPFESS